MSPRLCKTKQQLNIACLGASRCHLIRNPNYHGIDPARVSRIRAIGRTTLSYDNILRYPNFENPRNTATSSAHQPRGPGGIVRRLLNSSRARPTAIHNVQWEYSASVCEIIIHKSLLHDSLNLYQSVVIKRELGYYKKQHDCYPRAQSYNGHCKRGFTCHGVVQAGAVTAR